MLGRDVVANIAIPKTRNYFAGGYTYTAIAKTPATRTTDAEWAVFRTQDSTGHVDWAKKHVWNKYQRIPIQGYRGYRACS